jgi:hypothetical protein
MYGLFLIFSIFASYLFGSIDQPTKEDLICTNCTFINITIGTKSFCPRSYKLIYKYYLTIEVNNSYIEKIKMGGFHEYDQDKELINQTVPCYILKNDLYFTLPRVLPPENKYIVMFLIILMGIAFEFMSYHNLSF